MVRTLTYTSVRDQNQKMDSSATGSKGHLGKSSEDSIHGSPGKKHREATGTEISPLDPYVAGASWVVLAQFCLLLSQYPPCFHTTLVSIATAYPNPDTFSPVHTSCSRVSFSVKISASPLCACEPSWELTLTPGIS